MRWFSNQTVSQSIVVILICALEQHSQKAQVAAGLLPGGHQDDTRMRSHHLFRLDDDKSVASC